MNIKKHVLLVSLILLVVLCSLSPLYAFSIQKLDKNTITYINGKSVINVSIISDNAYLESNMRKELNNISKIVVKVDGKIVNTVNKDKGWNRYKYYPKAIIDSKTVVNGNVKGKKVSILTYSKNNKLIKSKTNIVKSVNYLTTGIIKSKNPKFARLTYKQACKSARKDDPKNFKSKYIGYRYYNGELSWIFRTINIKNSQEFINYELYDKDETLGML